MFVLDYLQMMYDQLKMIKRIYWVLEWIVLIDYFCKDNPFPCSWCKLVLKIKIWSMRISEKAQQIERWDIFDEWSIYFWLTPPMKNIKKPKNVKHLILINVQNDLFDTPHFLRIIIYLSKILKALSSNKNGILHFWKSQ